MAILGTILTLVGAVIAVVGGVMFLIVAFKKSVLWGLGCLIVPFCALVFLAMNWSKAGKPFLIQLAGTVLIFIGVFLSGKMGGAGN